MILKLFKYDFMNIGKKLIPFYITVLVISIINRFLIITADLNAIINNEGRPTGYQLFVLQMQVFLYTLFIITIIGISITTLVMIITRYNSSIYGSEGYLTNTLPLRPSQIIWAKFIIFIIWTVISTSVTIISLFLMVPIAVITQLLAHNRRLYEFVFELLNIFKNPEVIFTILIYILSNFLIYCRRILLLFFSIAFANLFRSYKLLIGIVVFVICDLIIASITSSITLFTYDNISNMSMSTSIPDLLNRGNIIIIIVNTLICILLFFSTCHFHKNYLNLE